MPVKIILLDNKIKILNLNMEKNKLQISTLTHRVSAIEVKMLHLQFRMKKIYQDQELVNKKKAEAKSNREKIRILTNSTYSIIDMLITMEYAYELMKDFFATKELTQHFDKSTYSLLNNVKKISEKWKSVRNKLGGHIDISVVEEMCKEHNFRGVFLSKDLETDVGMLNILLIESAINAARKNHDIFEKNLEMKIDLVNEAELLKNKLNEDWGIVFSYFEPLMKLLYKAGKDEKILNTTEEEREGIVKGD